MKKWLQRQWTKKTKETLPKNGPKTPPENTPDSSPLHQKHIKNSNEALVDTLIQKYIKLTEKEMKNK